MLFVDDGFFGTFGAGEDIEAIQKCLVLCAGVCSMTSLLGRLFFLLEVAIPDCLSFSIATDETEPHLSSWLGEANGA